MLFAGMSGSIVGRVSCLMGCAVLTTWLAMGNGVCVAQGPPAAAPAKAAAPAGPKKYKALPVFPRMVGESKDAKDLRKSVEKTVRSVLRGSTPFNDSQRTFDAWYTHYVFPMMTQVENLGQLSEMRLEFFKTSVQGAKAKELHDHLVQNLALPQMTAIATEDYHPAARCNAMLIIAGLNFQEGVTVGLAKTQPEPLLQALKPMLDALEDPQQIDAVRVAALVGIQRHVEMDRMFPADRPLSSAAKREIGRVMLDLVRAKQPPAGVKRSPEGHAWIQRRGIEVLAALGEVGDNGEVLAAVTNILADEDAPISLRCSAAGSLVRFNYSDPASVDAAGIARDLAKLATMACTNEVNRVEQLLAREAEDKELRQILTRGGGPVGPDAGDYSAGGEFDAGGPGVFPGAIPGRTAASAAKPLSSLETARIRATRRRIKYQLHCIDLALGSKEQPGLAQLAQEPEDQSAIAAIKARVGEILQVIDMAELDLESMVGEIRDKVAQLEPFGKAKPRAAGQPPAAPADDLPGGGAPKAELPGGGAPKADLPGGLAP